MTTVAEAELDLIAQSAESLLNLVSSMADAFSVVSQSLEQLRSRAVDISAPPDLEATKRNLISALDQCGNTCDIAIYAARHGRLDAGELANEIYEALCLRVAELTNASAVRVGEILRERANNVAAAYAGRVVKEPK